MIRERWWFLAIAASFVAIVGPGQIEGWIAPAAAPAELTRIEATTDGRDALVWGHSARLRQSCNYVRIEWYLGQRGAQTVPVRIETGAPILRARGAFDFGPWALRNLPAERVREGTFADVVHRCRLGRLWLPWSTVTPFYR